MTIHALTLTELHAAFARGEITLAELYAEHELRDRNRALLVPVYARRSVRELRSALATRENRGDDTREQ